MGVSLSDVEKAYEVVSQFLKPSPFLFASKLSPFLGCELFLKLENLQPTSSFKVRGACYKLSNLASQRSRGVITMSAGNHAQAVAFFAKQFGIPAIIVMPVSTPSTKIERTAQFGAQIILRGETLNESEVFVMEMAQEKGFDVVHPYDDLEIVAGQGTLGLEIKEYLGTLDALVVPIGGGGLISGIATVVKSMNPNVRIIGVESKSYPSMYASLNEGEFVIGGQTLAEGIAVKAPGKKTLPIVKNLVDDIILVSEDDIEEAVFLLASQERLVVEGAGSAGVAALLQNKPAYFGKKVATVLCGGNIDERMLSSVLLRGLAHNGQLAIVRARTKDSPGSLAELTRIIAKNGGNVMDVVHQRLIYDLSAKNTQIDITIETRSKSHASSILAELKEAGFDVMFVNIEKRAE